ncbi:MAG TPA: hypothetical protein VFX83_00140 [Azonexus sp.]|nr:hypothetical protein [Azonexus sp.]
MLSRRLLPWLFALTLLFAQAAAFAHTLSHLDAHDSALPDQTCEVCLAQASLGSAAPQKAFSLPVESGRPIGLPDVAIRPISVIVQSAQARAPPATV